MIELHNINCMEYLATCEDNAFELAIVDPPYGYGNIIYMPKERVEAFGGHFDKYDIMLGVIDSNQRSTSKVQVVHAQTSKETINSFAENNVSPPPEYFSELFRVSKNQIIWGGNYFLLPPSRGFVIWQKPTVSEKFTMAMAEYAWLSSDANSKVFSAAPQGTKKDPRIHPTQKPVKLYEWLLMNYAKEGDRILDTHLGSGSIALACHNLGFDLVGCKLDTDYFNAAQKRLKQHQSQLRIPMQ